MVVAGLSMGTQIPTVLAQHNGGHHSQVLESSVSITRARAIEIAQGLLAGTVKQIHLGKYQGKAAWKVRIISTDGTQKGKFVIDANNGDILNSMIKPFGKGKHQHDARSNQ